MKHRPEMQNKGFTLVELITTMVVLAIFGAIIFQYMGVALTGSVEPLENLGKSHELERALDNMILYFEDRKSRGTLIMTTFRGTIGNVNDSMDNEYGKYTVVQNGYITFNASLQESSDSLGTAPDDILKVTIKNDIGQTATVLFVQ